ncbi:hypothetical protein COD17_09680 [Bacillus thuringiensis]|nr:hypothetical protein COD17_09680 [Bacillus thuringiensis]
MQERGSDTLEKKPITLEKKPVTPKKKRNWLEFLIEDIIFEYIFLGLLRLIGMFFKLIGKMIMGIFD